MVAVLDPLTLRTGVDLPAEGFRAALLNGAQGAAMTREQTIRVLLAIGRAVAADDLRQL